jgi:hypothetical protein
VLSAKLIGQKTRGYHKESRINDSGMMYVRGPPKADERGGTLVVERTMIRLVLSIAPRIHGTMRSSCVCKPGTCAPSHDGCRSGRNRCCIQNVQGSWSTCKSDRREIGTRVMLLHCIRGPMHYPSKHPRHCIGISIFPSHHNRPRFKQARRGKDAFGGASVVPVAWLSQIYPVAISCFGTL